MLSTFPFAETLAACDLCGAPRMLTEDVPANIVRCAACGYRFVNPRPTQAAIAESYSASNFYDEWIHDEEGRQEMWSKRLRLFRNLGQDVRLLDVGAGIGTFLAMARDEFNWKVMGTEVSSSAIEIARRRYGLELMVGELGDISLRDESLDLITLWHVLEHVPSPAATIALCHRLLVPNGRLAIAIPNDNSERWWLVRAKARVRGSSHAVRYEPLMPGHEVHLSHFQSSVLTSALRSRGFSIEKLTVDDHYAVPTFRSKCLVALYRLVNATARLNFAQATLVVAKKA